MGTEFLLLNLAVFGASVLQSATGIGFGVIAGPILLIALNSGDAIHISIILNLLIAGLLAPSLWRDANKDLLRGWTGMLVVGVPLGLAIFLYVDIALLKMLAGLAVLFTAAFVMRNRGVGARHGKNTPKYTGGHAETLAIGLVSGIMGGSLAMPGPIPAAWMSIRGYDKSVIRATILVLFVFSYSVTLALQLVFAEFTPATWRLGAQLAPATIVGIFAGRLLVRYISEIVFRLLLLAVLLATALSLLVTLL